MLLCWTKNIKLSKEFGGKFGGNLNDQNRSQSIFPCS